jgi:seryl-tRNA synthetase
MTSQKIVIPEGVRWDDLAVRRYRENAPYFLNGLLVRGVYGRVVELEGSMSGEANELQFRGEALARKIAEELRDSMETIVAEFATEPRCIAPDPMPALLASRSLVQTGLGRFVYGGIFLELMEALDSLVAAFAVDRGAAPQLYPTTVKVDTLVRSGYLKTFAQHAYFVAPAGLSSVSVASVAATNSAAELDSYAVRGLLGSHDQVLAPTVCFHCFESLQGTRVPAPCSFTGVNHCSRFEIDADATLSRLHTFRMREYIVFGKTDYVEVQLNDALTWSTELLRRWGIAYRVATATDPFFAGAQTGKAFYQSTFALKRELQLHLPFNQSWIAFASFNNHQRAYTKAFDIGDDTSLSSGCVGWGWERFAYGVLASVGVDPLNWPAVMRTDLSPNVAKVSGGLRKW